MNPDRPFTLVLSGGGVTESQACLIGNRRALREDPERLEATRWLLELMEAYLRSRHGCWSLSGREVRGRSERRLRFEASDPLAQGRQGAFQRL